MRNTSKKYENDYLDDRIIDNIIVKDIKREGSRLSKSICKKHINYDLDYELILRSAVKQAKYKLQNKFAELYLEYNIPWPYNAEWPFHSNLIRLHADTKIKLKEYYRLIGWLEEAKNFPLLINFIKRTQSSNGQGSPHNHINIWHLSMMGSPGKVDFIIRKLYYLSNMFIKMIDDEFRVSDISIACYLNELVWDIDLNKNCKINVKPNNKLAMKIAISTFIHKFRVERRYYKYFQKYKFENTTFGEDYILDKKPRDLLIFLNRLKHGDTVILLEFL